MPSLNTTLRVLLNADLVGAGDLVTPTSNLRYKHSKNLATGTGSSQADKIFHDTRTLAASANEDLDLAAGINDPFGVALTFAKVKMIVIAAAPGNTNNVVIKPAASNGFTGPFGAAAHTQTLPPGGIYVATAPVSGWTVTASTGDLLNIANSGAGSSVTYDVIIVGTSA